MKKKVVCIWMSLGILLIAVAGLYLYSWSCFLANPFFNSGEMQTVKKTDVLHETELLPPVPPEAVVKEEKSFAAAKTEEAKSHVAVDSFKAKDIFSKRKPEKKPEEIFAEQAMERLPILGARVKHPGEVWARMAIPANGANHMDDMMKEMAKMYRDTMDHDQPVRVVIWVNDRMWMVRTFFGPQIF